MNTRERSWLALAVFGAVLLAGCAAGPNPLVDQARGDVASAGFWLGLWHGLISPITFLVSLFNDDLAVYEVFNTGHWYDFGFGLGVLFALSGAGGGAAARGRTRRRTDTGA